MIIDYCKRGRDGWSLYEVIIDSLDSAQDR